MFTSKDSDEKSGLDEAIDSVLAEMASVNADSDEYAKMVDQLVKLYPLKETEAKRKVSPDTMALIAGNLLGIMLIVGHERAHVVTSKALNFVTKLR